MREPNRISCKDGTVFFVKERATGAIVVSAPREDAVSVACGLSRYRAPGSEAYAEHQGMPVEAVRAYAVGHGGVREGGPTAIALLKKLPSKASQGAEEGAPDVPFPPMRGSSVAGRTAAAAPAGTPQERLGGGSETLDVDLLTPAVIDARKLLDELDGPFLFQGREPATDEEAHVVWSARAFESLRHRSRLDVVDFHRFASHPLRDEALALRERLQRHLLTAISHLTTDGAERKAG